MSHPSQSFVCVGGGTAGGFSTKSTLYSSGYFIEHKPE